MTSASIFLVVAALLITLVRAAPAYESSPVISLDASCSPKTGYTCLGSSFGPCCSKFSYCGNDPSYCDLELGCQSNFGTCNNPKPLVGGTLTTDGKFGDTITCSDSDWDGTCSSSAGTCVDPSMHPDSCLFSNGCQPALGLCLEVTPTARAAGYASHLHGEHVWDLLLESRMVWEYKRVLVMCGVRGRRGSV